jgi:hypothetical protein
MCGEYVKIIPNVVNQISNEKLNVLTSLRKIMLVHQNTQIDSNIPGKRREIGNIPQ